MDVGPNFFRLYFLRLKMPCSHDEAWDKYNGCIRTAVCDLSTSTQLGRTRDFAVTLK